MTMPVGPGGRALHWQLLAIVLLVPARLALVEAAWPAPQLSSTFYKMYSDNARFTEDEWRREMRALRAANLTSLALPYTADAQFAVGSTAKLKSACNSPPRPAAGDTCPLGVMAAFYPSTLPCTAPVAGAPLEGLLLAAKAEGVRVYLGMGNPSGNAWDCMGFPEGNNFSHSAVEYYDTYYRVQRDIATELWQRYAASYAGIIAGFYLNLEVGARDHSSLRAI